MNVELDMNRADLAFFVGFHNFGQTGFGLDNFVQIFHNVWFSFKITVFRQICAMSLSCVIIMSLMIDLCKFVQVWFLFNANETSLGIVQHTVTHIVLVQMFNLQEDDQEHQH